MLSTPIFKGQGIGNQLSCYVTARCLALDKGYDFGVMYPENFKGFSFMELDMGLPVIGGEIPIEGKTPTVLPEGLKRYYHEEFIGNGDYDPKMFELEDNTLIHGNLQGELYFKKHEDEVREWLKVEPLELPDDLCIINFRGGEYKYVEEFHLPKSYWKQAISIMKAVNPDMRFEVHTDDPDEARIYFDCPIIKDIGLNWRSVRYAKYLITSNSSFAFLPAWLGDANLVISPKFWGRRNLGYWHLEQNKTNRFTYI